MSGRFGLQRGRVWLLLLVLAVVVSAVFAWRTPVDRGDGARSYTSHSSNRWGCKVLYRWLESRKVPVRRWEQSFQKLPPTASVLFVIQPEMGLDPGELKALRKWVSDGRTLVVAGYPGTGLLADFGLEVSVYRVVADNASSAAVQPGPYTDGVRDLGTRETVFFTGFKTDRPEMVVHYQGPRGAVLAVIQEGKGRLVALADPNLMSNQGLRKADRARLVFNILRLHAGTGEVLIDEYHHGYGRATSVLEHIAKSRVMGPLVQTLVLLVLLWAARGRRFGPPRPVIAEQRRSTMEYVTAMAQLLLRGRAEGHSLRMLIRWVEEQAKKDLVDGDSQLREVLEAAREQSRVEYLGSSRLLATVSDLYQALNDARRRVPGTLLRP